MIREPARIHFPLRGAWRVLRPPGHHRFAFDFVAVRGEPPRQIDIPAWRYLLLGAPVDAVYGWSQPVFSPADARILQASDGCPDRIRLHAVRDLLYMLVRRPRIQAGDIRPFAGNYLIREADGFWVFLAHLRLGSLRISPGQAVWTGEQLGQVGNSGFTLAPHLHLQVLDGPDPLTAETVPFRIDRYERLSDGRWETMLGGSLAKGGLIRVADRNDPPQAPVG